MKTLRMLGMLAMTISLSVSIASCGDDDDVAPNKGNNTSVVVQPDQNEQGSLMGNGLKFIITSFTEPRTCQVVGTTPEIDRDSFTGGIEVPAYINYNGAKYAVTSIGKSAFSGFSKMTAVSLPSTLKTIEDGHGWYDYDRDRLGAFEGCCSLTSVTIPNSVTKIGTGTFRYCTSLVSVEIPNSVTEIGQEAFSGCSSLASVNIPNSVTEIGYQAFSYCKSLVSVEIPNSVTKVKQEVFEGCSGLASVTIPNSVTKIGKNAFHGCTGLTSIHIQDMDAWCKIDFSYDSNNSYADDVYNPLSYAHNLYLNDKLVTDLVIPNSVTRIGSVAFSGCSNISSVTIPNSVTSIGGGAFYGCSSLTSVTIPNSVTSIGGDAFRDCTSLTSVTIPNSVTRIGSGAFYGCSNLAYVIVKADTPPNCYYSPFYDSYGATLYVPTSSVQAYKQAYEWCKFKTILGGAENM